MEQQSGVVVAWVDGVYYVRKLPVVVVQTVKNR